MMCDWTCPSQSGKSLTLAGLDYWLFKAAIHHGSLQGREIFGIVPSVLTALQYDVYKPRQTAALGQANNRVRPVSDTICLFEVYSTN